VQTQADANLEDLWNKYESEEAGMRFTPELRKFYTEYAHRVQQQIAPQVSQMQKQYGVMLFNSWYADAVREAGDEPIPPRQEAYNMLQLNPQLAQRALDRMEVFGDVSVNPIQTIFDQWRSMRTPSGLTKAERAKRDADAKKLRDLKSLEKAVPERKPSTRKQQESDLRELLESKTLDDL
jgi:hypothetical protein